MMDQFRNWANHVPSAVIDTFFCHIEAPDVYPHEYYNPHYNGYGIKYQIVIAIGISAICNLSHSFKGHRTQQTEEDKAQNYLIYQAR